jgi:cytoskeletal protein RodZ
MTSQSWNNPWKLTAIGMALVVATALATGLVVANLSGRDTEPKKSTDATAPSRPAARSAGTSSTPATSAAPATPTAPAASSVPSQSVIAACNQAAASQVASRDKTMDTVKNGAIGAVAGAVLGAAGGAIADGGSGAGKGAAIGGLVGAGGGTLYGLNENRKHDEHYREAYSACMRSRGYVG